MARRKPIHRMGPKSGYFVRPAHKEWCAAHNITWGEIASKYKRETNLNPFKAIGRIDRALASIAEYGFESLDQFAFEQHLDFYWSARRNRTEPESYAVILGTTNAPTGAGYPVSRVWFVPKTLPKFAEKSSELRQISGTFPETSAL